MIKKLNKKQNRKILAVLMAVVITTATLATSVDAWLSSTLQGGCF